MGLFRTGGHFSIGLFRRQSTKQPAGQFLELRGVHMWTKWALVAVSKASKLQSQIKRLLKQELSICPAALVWDNTMVGLVVNGSVLSVYMYVSILCVCLSAIYSGRPAICQQAFISCFTDFPLKIVGSQPNITTVSAR